MEAVRDVAVAADRTALTRLWQIQSPRPYCSQCRCQAVTLLATRSQTQVSLSWDMSPYSTSYGPLFGSVTAFSPDPLSLRSSGLRPPHSSMPGKTPSSFLSPQALRANPAKTSTLK